MAGRPSQRRDLAVWMNDQRVGCWSVSPTAAPSFSYDAAWLQWPMARPLSLSLPIGGSPRAIKGDRVQSFFDNLLPDSASIRQRLQQQHGAASTSAFDLLSVLGRDCAGAVTLMPTHAQPADSQRVEAEPLGETQLIGILNACIGVPPPSTGGAKLAPIAQALSGAQAKTALLWHQRQWCRPLGATPSTHILKLPLGAEQPGSALADPRLNTSLENEWLCSRLFKAFGFDVADSQLAQIGSHKVLVIQRFDRRWVDESWWARLPMEDFCQATGTAPALAYQRAGGPGLDRLLDLLRGSDQATHDRERFLAAQVLGWMLAATDQHAKSFSLLLRAQGHFVLAPFYDVMSAWPIVGRAPSAASLRRLRFALAPGGADASNGYDDLTLQRWSDLARRNALGHEFGAVIEGLASWADNAIEAVAAQLQPGFPTSVSGAIFEGLRRSARQLIA